ncbi:hypothetical protein ANN_13714 [Periplaneta americana]|uniref:Uncharacterized protein n=1 Tax=Periplaneta americana TaxID=6978 RepID=A0ABQ8SVM2_PERAM|nr:hypothetical protein ANN_13714 [Periplaneta americana]
MNPGSSTKSYPALPHIGLRETPEKNLNQSENEQPESKSECESMISEDEFILRHSTGSSSEDGASEQDKLQEDIHENQQRTTRTENCSLAEDWLVSSSDWILHVEESLTREALVVRPKTVVGKMQTMLL